MIKELHALEGKDVKIVVHNKWFGKQVYEVPLQLIDNDASLGFRLPLKEKYSNEIYVLKEELLPLTKWENVYFIRDSITTIAIIPN